LKENVFEEPMCGCPSRLNRTRSIALAVSRRFGISTDMSLRLFPEPATPVTTLDLECVVWLAQCV
jgi:hypothetical protein